MNFLKWYSVILMTISFLYSFTYFKTDPSLLPFSIPLIPVMAYLWLIVKREGGIKKGLLVTIGVILALAVIIFLYMFLMTTRYPIPVR